MLLTQVTSQSLMTLLISQSLLVTVTMGARRNRQGGHLPPGYVVKSFLCISSYSKTPRGLTIYALF